MAGTKTNIFFIFLKFSVKHISVREDTHRGVGFNSVTPSVGHKSRCRKQII
jgi:hypothetical protein